MTKFQKSLVSAKKKEVIEAEGRNLQVIKIFGVLSSLLIGIVFFDKAVFGISSTVATNLAYSYLIISVFISIIIVPLSFIIAVTTVIAADVHNEKSSAKIHNDLIRVVAAESSFPWKVCVFLADIFFLGSVIAAGNVWIGSYLLVCTIAIKLLMSYTCGMAREYVEKLTPENFEQLAGFKLAINTE